MLSEAERITIHQRALRFSELSAELSKLVAEKQLSSSTKQMILNTIKGTPRGSEQRYQNTLNILELLRTAKTDEEIINSLQNPK